MSAADLAFTFDSNNLEALVPGLVITDIDTGHPERKVNIYDVESANAAKVADSFYKKRFVTVRAEIGSSSGRAGLEASIDLLNRYTDTQEGILKVKQAGVFREYTATRGNLVFNERKSGFASVSVQFICSTPFSYETSSTTLYTLTNKVGHTYDLACNFGGNTKQQPTITFLLNSFLGGTSKTVTITNPATTEAIAIQRTWTAADSLVINGESKTITVNGTAVDFDGKIPQWSPGAQIVRYTDDLSHINFNLTVAYRKRWI